MSGDARSSASAPQPELAASRESSKSPAAVLEFVMALQRAVDETGRVAIAVLAAWLVVACGGEPTTEPDEPKLVVGTVDDSDALVAVLQDGSDRAAYVCGGPSTLDSWTRWYTVPSGDALVQDGWTLSVDATGTAGSLVDPEGVAHHWRQHPESVDRRDRLYSVVDSGCRTGAIVIGFEDGATVQGVWCDELGRYGQVTPVKPAEADQLVLSAITPAGERELVASRVRTAADLTR